MFVVKLVNDSCCRTTQVARGSVKSEPQTAANKQQPVVADRPSKVAAKPKVTPAVGTMNKNNKNKQKSASNDHSESSSAVVAVKACSVKLEK